MTEPAVDNLARSLGTDRRRAMLALGLGGLAAALAGSSASSAKSGSGKKRKKWCKRQKQSCISQMRTYCAGWGDEAPFCEEEFLPCCETCDVGAGVICTLEGISILA